MQVLYLEEPLQMCPHQVCCLHHCMHVRASGWTVGYFLDIHAPCIKRKCINHAMICRSGFALHCTCTCSNTSTYVNGVDMPGTDWTQMTAHVVLTSKYVHGSLLYMANCNTQVVCHSLGNTEIQAHHCSVLLQYGTSILRLPLRHSSTKDLLYVHVGLSAMQGQPRLCIACTAR